MTRGRTSWLLGVLVVAIASLWTDAATLTERVLPRLARTELAALDRLAGLRAADGSSRAPEPVPVRLLGDAPAELGARVREAVVADGVYAVGDGPHQLIAELVVLERACALRLSLERRGWTVHPPTPSRVRLMPVLVVFPLLLGLGVLALRRDVVLALVAAAATAQLAVSAWPWPAELPPAPVLDDVLAGPLVAPLMSLAQRLDRQGTMIAGGVIALCLVLAWFDHRRSKHRPPLVLMRGFAAVLATLALLEAATRAALPSWCLTGLGMLATLVVLVLALSTRAVWHDVQRIGSAP